MVRPQTITKYMKIKKMLKSGDTIRHIKNELQCSEDTINKAKIYVPLVPKKIRTAHPNPTKKFDLDMAVILKSLIKKVSKQYWNKSKEDIADFEKFEAYMTKRTGLEFNFVLRRKLEEALQQADTEIRASNGDH